MSQESTETYVKKVPLVLPPDFIYSVKWPSLWHTEQIPSEDYSTMSDFRETFKLCTFLC